MDSSSRIEETTPLLSRATGQRTSRYKKNSPKLIYGYVLGVLFAFMALIYFIRSTLPTPLSDVEAREKNGFAGIHCYNEYLSHFNAPHSANQRENGYLKDWIVKLAHEFKAEANNNGIEMDIIDQDPTDIVTKRNKFSADEYWLVESRNVMIRLVGQSNNKNESFLVNAHYDSVSTSHGVTDNGMGTAVALELLRYFVQHPPKNTVIFLFNNFEEGGLIGADAFVLHPWFSTIKLFVNLEGTGAGGRAILLRSNILSAVQGLASSNAGYLHASPLGKDLLDAKLLKSDTDYTVFSKYGVPGLDISFYYPRSHYHTQRDDLAHTTPQSLQHMGQMALGSVLSIDQSESIIQKAGKPEPIIYYDILGRVMLVYSFFTCQLLNVLSLVLIPLGLFTWFWFSTNNGGHVDAKRVALKHNLWLIGQGLLSTLVALVSMVVFVAFFSWILMLINPSATYGSTYFVTVYLFAVSFLGLVLSQWILTKHSFMLEESLNTTQVGFYGLTTFWWLLLLAATILATQKMATTYFAIYFFISSSLATVLLTGTMPSKTEEDSDVAINGSRYWSLAFLIQVLLPGTLLTEFLFLVIDSMRHTSADGTPEWAIYGLLATPIVLIVLHLLPWAQAAGELRTTTFCASIVFVVIMMVCFIASPFNDDSSPNRIVFNQEYNASEALSTVTLITGSTFGVLEKILKKVLPSSEYDTVHCEPYLTYQTRCSYQTLLTPVYARHPSKEIKISYLPSACHEGICKLNITTQVQNSLLCQLEFTNPNIRDLHAWLNGHYVEPKGDNSIHALTVYSKEQASTVVWDISYNADQDDVGKAIFSCIYDEWTEGELPAFTTLRDNMPHDALLTIKGGVGLAKVHYTPAVSL